MARELGGVGSKVVFEDERVRVWVLKLAPGERSDVHQHDLDHLLIQVKGDRIAVDPEPDTASGEGEMPVQEWVDKYDASGTRVLGERIRPTSDTRVVRKRGGKVHVTEGPYAESVEQLSGFYLIESDDLDDLLACVGILADEESGLEVRACADSSGGG